MKEAEECGRNTLINASAGAQLRLAQPGGVRPVLVFSTGRGRALTACPEFLAQARATGSPALAQRVGKSSPWGLGVFFSSDPHGDIVSSSSGNRRDPVPCHRTDGPWRAGGLA